MGAYDWDAGWTLTNLSGQNIADVADFTTAVISQDGKLATEIGVEIEYGVSAVEGAKVYVLRDVDGTNYEAEADDPWGFAMPATVSTMHRRTVTVPGSISDFKVLVTNDVSAGISATVQYRQAVV